MKNIGTINSFLVYSDASLISLSTRGGIGLRIIEHSTGNIQEWSEMIEFGRQCVFRAELFGALRGIASTPPGAKVEICIDNVSVLEIAIYSDICSCNDERTLRMIIPAHQERKRQRKIDLALIRDADLWMTLADLCAEREVMAKWVKGHSLDRENLRVDALAAAAAKRWSLV